MAVLNDLDRFHLAKDTIDRISIDPQIKANIKDSINKKLEFHKEYIQEHGEDIPEVRNWKWPY